MTQIEIFNYKQKTWRKTHIREFDVTTPLTLISWGTLNPCHNYSKNLSHCFLYAVTTFSTPAILRKEKTFLSHYHHCTLIRSVTHLSELCQVLLCPHLLFALINIKKLSCTLPNDSYKDFVQKLKFCLSHHYVVLQNYICFLCLCFD